jgi:hypothetical protein
MKMGIIGSANINSSAMCKKLINEVSSVPPISSQLARMIINLNRVSILYRECVSSAQSVPSRMCDGQECARIDAPCCKLWRRLIYGCRTEIKR